MNIEFDEVVELDEVVALAVSDEALELAAGGAQGGLPATPGPFTDPNGCVCGPPTAMN